MYKVLTALSGFLFAFSSLSAEHLSHEMQHGFILHSKDRRASHLVATGHHSRQVEVTGRLHIPSQTELQHYRNRQAQNNRQQSYFVFQAQALDLPGVSPGQYLRGHIVESKSGQYEPKNIVVREAVFFIEAVQLNLENPFFGQH